MAAFFVRRPIVAIVIAIMTVLVGLLAARSLPVAQFPPIIPPQIQVSTNYPGADAVAVEQAIAAPLEQQMNGVEDMLYVQSTNANDGTMALTVTFDIDTDPDIDQVAVQNRAAQATSNLPPDVAQYGLSYRKATGTPTMLIGFYSPDRRYDSLFLANYASINIIDALYRVNGVGDVRLFGSSDYAMRIWVKPDVLARMNLTVADVARAVRAQNDVNPAGRLGAEPGPPGVEKTYTVRAQGRLVTAEEFGRIVVRADPGGAVIRLADVARIELGALNYQQRARVNGQPGALVAVFQTPGSNALDVARGVRAALEELQAGFPAGLAYAVTLDTSLPVAAGLSEMLETIAVAMLLVTLVVFLFLQSWRATLIPMVAVPVSLVGTFAVFPLLGFGINTLSLFGLVLAIGLVVDDAIVVVEAVQQHIDEGMPPREATLQAMREVSGPVVAIALVLSAVFIPMAFVDGIQGRLNTQFAVTIAISVVISGASALTLSPALAAMLLRPRRPSGGPLARFFALFNRLFDRGARGYVRASHGLIRKAALGVVVLVLFGAAAGVMGSRLPTSFLPEEDQGYLLVNITLPPAASLERTDVAARKVEAVLGETEGVKNYNSVIGLSMLTRVTATNSGFFFVQLEPWDERGAGLDAAAIRDRLTRALATAVPEATAMAYAPASIPGLGNAGGFSMWVQDRSGGAVEHLDQSVKDFLAAARKRPEIGAVTSPFSAGVPQVFAEVDRDKAMAQGVAVEDVYTTLQANLGGVYVNQFNRFGRQWRVFVGAEGDYRRREEDIGDYRVRNDQGRMVPLSTVVTTRRTSGPEYTNRFNLYRAAHVIGAAAPGYSSGDAMAALEEVAAATLPREMGIDWADLSYQERRASGTTAFVFGLSLVFVFLILAALYESWSLPLSVLLSVPIAVFGAFAGLMLRGYHLDVFGQIGLVMLIGLAAKNAILIVEFAVDELGRGRDLVGAALEGARRRLRPILMTSFAFILGCAPLYVASGSGAAGRRILGTVVIAGMLAATAIAVFLIPLLFVLVERIAGKRGAPEPPPTALASPPGEPWRGHGIEHAYGHAHGGGHGHSHGHGYDRGYGAGPGSGQGPGPGQGHGDGSTGGPAW